MEEDLMKVEKEITQLETTRDTQVAEEKPTNIRVIMAYIKYFSEHLEELLLHLSNPLNKAAYFSVLFDKVPTYQEIKGGTQKIAQLAEVNELFRLLNTPKALMVTCLS